jgi:aminoglycoside phosphotransferase family enzyme/predicted kinase
MTDKLIKNLQNAKLYDHPVTAFRVIETHCSWVILTGTYAYKIKKSVNFGFLDYSSLEKRKLYCQQELQRNQLLAAEIYVKLMPIYGTAENPMFAPTGDPIEYAVQMREFPQDQLLSQLLLQQQLTADIITKLADTLVEFHQQAKLVPQDSPLGSASHAQQQVTDNFSQIKPLLTTEADKNELTELEKQTIKYYEQIKSVLEQRKKTNFVRQCHGDAHLNNIFYFHDKTIIFDCIDFNNDFCWTDTMGDLGFITMDLIAHQQHTLNNILLNRYLEISGDYPALQVLPYFQAYRAMVRAKIALFSNDPAHYKKYLTLAQSFLYRNKPRLFIMCGLSASGKSTIAHELAQQNAAIIIFSDRERKRIVNIALAKDCSDAVLAGLYQPQQTLKTYAHLLKLADLILDAGYSVIVDATFREQEQRQQFLELAKAKQIAANIVYCEADLETLRTRLLRRQQQTSNISEASVDVLQMQWASFEPFSAAEKALLITIDTTKPHVDLNIP